MAERCFLYRNKMLTYEEYLTGPGKHMNTKELEASMDKASGAFKSRRSLQRAMTQNGYKLISVDGEGVKFSSENGDKTFNSFGEVEKYLVENGMIKDEKAEAEKREQEKKEKDKARKEALRAKEAARKAAQKEREAARKAAQKEKEKAQKEAQKQKEAAKKEKEAARLAARKEKEAAAKAGNAERRGSKRKPAEAVKTSENPKASTRQAKMGSSASVSKNLAENGFVVRIGRKEYTQNRIRTLALDAYQYDMGGNPDMVKKLETILVPEKKKCIFIVNGRQKGEFDL